MVPAARFTEFLADIEPSSTTKANASAAHNKIRDHLWWDDDFSYRMEGAFLSGSYKRDTAIRPRKIGDEYERPDVDVIVVTKFTTADDPEDVLHEIKDALEPTFTVDRVNWRSVRVNTTNVEVDVVPIIADGGAYLIPDRRTGEWITTNPPAHTTWSTEQNTDFEGRFKKLVKLLKWWRRINPTDKRPKGFVLEVLTALHAPNYETDLGEAFAQLLENIHSDNAALADLGLKPFIQDPGLTASSDILAKVTLAQWRTFLEKARVYAGYARRAQDATDTDEATTYWRKVFGDRFPATADVLKSSSSVSYAAASGGLFFPNAPAAPNKPRGFA